MIEAALEGVDFVVANTDAQALSRSQTDKRVQMGAAITEGLGAGARPEVGEQSAEDSLDEIREHLAGAHMVFITAGMGGGTGTGGAPVVARAAREMGILTVGVVTKPFHFEGSRRMKLAENGIDQLQDHVDTLIVIPNQNLFRIATEKTTFAEAFSMADQVLHSGVRGITDLMVMPGLINLDFADVRAVMNEMGKAMMGTGEAEGEKRAIEAAQAAISNPLLDDVSMKGATGVLINITGGYDMTLYEVDEAANEIRAEVDPEANIIVGSTFDENMEGSMRVSVVATGIDAETMIAADPRTRLRTPAPIERPGLDRQPVERPPVERQPVERQAGERQPAERVAAERPAAAASTANDQILPWKRMNTDRPGRVMAGQRSDLDNERDAEEAVLPKAAGAEGMSAAPQPPVETRTNELGPVEAPQVLIDQARLEQEAATLNERYEQRRASQSVSGAAETASEEPKRGFSLFGRRRKPAEPAPKAAPAPVAEKLPPVQAPRPASGDLFGDSLDEGDLEIPAFLRRQAN